jgi:hypothetical protein
MYYDLDTNDFELNEILEKLLGGAGEVGESAFADDYETDVPEVEDKVPHLVVDVDSSQFSALVDLANAKNLAIEGPPGTGKLEQPHRSGPPDGIVLSRF